jgi:large subunit ribosomal protein L35Ae
LVKIEGVNDKSQTNFYLGKRLAFVYKATNPKTSNPHTNRKARIVWGRITTAHGNNGVVRAKFARNLPPKSFGAPLRIMLYPSSI